jgi:hypothetical protein
MPKYYISIEDGEPIKDPVAEDLADDDAARRLASQIANDLSRNHGGGSEWHVRLRNEEGVVVADVAFEWEKRPLRP